MAIVNNESLVKFVYGVASKAVSTAGHITFASDTRQLFVGDGDKAVAFAGNVANAVFADKKLTITYNDGTATAVLDFSDVASAEGVSSLLGNLRKDVEANKTAIATETAERKAQDKIFDTSIKALENAVGEGGSVSTQITNAINELGGSAEDVDDSSFVKVAVTSEKGEVKTVTVTTDNIAKASDLSDVSTRLDSFLNGEGLADTIDTLKDIQEWINGDGVNATELTQAIAEEAQLRALADSSIRTDFAVADTSLSNRIKVVEGDYLKASDKTELSNAISGVSDVANAAAVKTTTDVSLALKADASTVYTKSETYTKTEVDSLVNGAKENASTAESNAKTYADTIKVNGQVQSNQEITLSGVNIKVGGSGTNKDASLSAAVEDLYTKVDAASKAGVQSLSVDTNSSNYAEVSGATGAVTLKIKKVALADASDSNTGVADANDVKKSIVDAISTVQGGEDDDSTAATVAGAKAYADAQIEANALRWTVLS